MKITRRQLRKIIKEVNDQDLANAIENIIDKFYEKAEEFEQYTPLSLEELTSDELDVITNFAPFDEFAPIEDSGSSAMLELSDEQQKYLADFLAKG